MLVKIKRQESPNSEVYWQNFLYDGTKETTVSAVLEFLNNQENLVDIDGNKARHIRWDCSCLQKMCGACAMIINGVPALACETFLRDLKGETLILEPLSKFPVVSDLVVDRSIIYENLKNAETYLGEYEKMKPKDYLQLYSTARCLKCGLCLEACPNYKKGKNFFGANFANEVYLMRTQSVNRKQELKKSYNEHFAKGCSKALACVNICPMKIDTLTSIARLNRK